MLRLVQFFPNFTSTDSLFVKMISLGAPWSSSEGNSMDIAYFTMWASIASPSPFTIINSTNGVANSQLIASVLWDVYGRNWQKLWEGFNKEYDPIENYNLSETIDRTLSDDRIMDTTGTLDSTVDGTASGNNKDVLDQTVKVTGTTSVTDDSNGTSALEHGEIITKEAEADSYVYGFNSTVKVPSSVQIESGSENHTGTDTTTTSGHETTDTTMSTTTETDATHDQTYSGTSQETRKDSTSEKRTDNDNIKEDIIRQRSGNVGQNSYQELLKQEFELWKWNFFKQVFADVDTFLILSVYDGCQFSQLN